MRAKQVQKAAQRPRVVPLAEYGRLLFRPMIKEVQQ
jgi:hypothetical protein